MVKIRVLLASLAALTTVTAVAMPQAGGDAKPPGLALQGDISPVHDPAIFKQGGAYYLFTTSQISEKKGLIHVRTSPDLINWARAEPVFAEIPAWATKAISGTRGIWAPDISKTGDEYRLYYSISTFGKNRSAIGLATARSLDSKAPGGGWTDKGSVIESQHTDDHNAIDPAVFTDAQGRQWMAFGSFWTGLKMVRLDPVTGMRSAEDRKLYSIARRRTPGAVEAPFVIRRGGFYYLFASFDFCCRGAKSTYYTVVGRSKEPTGPYVDREGKDMMDGGGFVVLHAQLDATKRFVGPGHAAVLQEGGREHIVYHAYDTKASGAPTLRIQRLGWTEDGWPVGL
ncbi:arabinan endo-1,5-alpha-L-arabinosidase [Sphingomonas sp.]|jgi:arabinan endo-1,5-alpha-L-arabinosidase|uniref:arabinan endo-1,5-alpha-L-arabinosidase n=1 Tax=Sphingomonas sp. TaxID=28214 RepID=UPI002ED99C0E